MNVAKAITTSDGYFLRMSDDEEVHSFYGTPAYAAEIAIPLSPMQEALAWEMHQRSRLQEIHRCSRSSIDQLAIFGGEDSSTRLEFDNHHAILNTYITCVEGRDNRLLQALRRVIESGRRAYYMRLLLTPHESKISERQLPVLTGTETYYDWDDLPIALLEQLWTEDHGGREKIRHAKKQRPMRSTMRRGEFLVAELNGMDIDCSSSNNLWVLKRKVRRGDSSNKTSIRHGDACGFDPHRSTKRRQGEFLCLEGEESTENLIVMAEEHRLDYVNSNGRQLHGV